MTSGFGELHIGFMLAWYVVDWFKYVVSSFIDAFVDASDSDYKYEDDDTHYLYNWLLLRVV